MEEEQFPGGIAAKKEDKKYLSPRRQDAKQNSEF
jgi:hypothetical protein